MKLNKIYCGEALTVLKTFPSNKIDCVITSPPYWNLRDYQTAKWEGGDINCNHVRDNKIAENCNTGQKNLKYLGSGDSIYKIKCKKCGAVRKDNQLGLEATHQDYINKLCNIFDEIKRVLKPTGTCFVNLGDTYVDKELMQIPSRFAIEMSKRGWLLRNNIIWQKNNSMPFPVTDRFTVDFENIFFFTKNKQYYFEQQREPISREPIKRPKFRRETKKNKNLSYNNQMAWHSKVNRGIITGRNKRCVWRIPTKPYSGAHFAVYPPKLIETPIKAGCPEFVCSRCGFIKEKIIKRTSMSKDYVLKNAIQGKNRAGNLGISKSSTLLLKGGGTHYNRWKAENPDQVLGYTDCGCGAEFIGGIVLDPFFGSGTTGVVAMNLNRNFIGIELNSNYVDLAQKRINLELEKRELQLF